MVGFLKRMFGGGSAGGGGPDPASQSPDAIHQDIEIRATPIKEAGGQWRVAGTLTKIEGEQTHVRKFIRADLVNSEDEARTASVNKAKQILDQNGAYVWKGPPDHPV